LIKLGDFVSRGQYGQVSGMNVGFFTDCSDVVGGPRFTGGLGARSETLAIVASLRSPTRGRRGEWLTRRSCG
jgi:hypothetical protein